MRAYIYVYVCAQVSVWLYISMCRFINGHNFRHRLRPIRCASTDTSICGAIRKHV